MKARRVFSKAKGEVSRSMRLPQEMMTLIEQQAEKEGESPSAYIVLALDWYFQSLAEKGEIPWPAEEAVTPPKKKKR